MRNHRNRRAAAPRPARIKPALSIPVASPAFPADVAIPPYRGAVSRAIALPEPAEPALATLFAPAPAPKAKTPAKKRKPAAIRRKAHKKAKARGKAPPRGPRLAPALPLPDQAEPLVAAAPLPRGRALMLRRPGGLATAMADWIGGQLVSLWQRLGGVPTARPAPRRSPLNAQELELRRLRAENRRLQAQLAALNSLQQPRKPPRARNGQPMPTV